MALPCAVLEVTKYILESEGTLEGAEWREGFAMGQEIMPEMPLRKKAVPRSG